MPTLAASADVAAGPNALERLSEAERVSVLLRADYFQSGSRLDGEKGLLGTTIEIKALPKLSDAVDGKIEARLSAPDVRGRPGYDARAELLEGYLTVHLAHADLRVGRQIVVWGRADGINPTDNLTPRDYIILLPLEEDQRFGINAVKLDAYLSPAFTLTAFATSLFEPSRFPLPTDGAIVESHTPPHTASNAEGGLRLNRTSDALDWSVSYYHGYSLLPAAQAVDAHLELSFAQINVLGADIARNFGHFGFRSEAAYTWPTDREAMDPNVRHPRLLWVGGIDRTFLENLNLNVQIFVRFMPRYEKPTDGVSAAAGSAAILNGIIDGQEARTSHGMTFRVSERWLNDTFTAEVFAVANFVRGDRYMRPLLTYSVSDHFKVLLGANLYRGGPSTPYGVLRPNSGAFLEGRYAF